MLCDDQLFTHYKNKDHGIGEYQRNRLIKLGFRPHDLNTLAAFVVGRDIDAEYKIAEKQVIEKYADKVRANHSAGIDNKDLMYECFMQRMQAVQRVYRDWAIDLLNQFDKQRQRILISDALSRQKSMAMIFIGTFEELAPELEGYFVDGKL